VSRAHCIFLIGPGGTGKSTLGPALARRSSASFLDLDLEVCRRVAAIPNLIAARGYATYCQVNAAIAAQLVLEAEGRVVMATSSGFLTHDEQPAVVARNLDLVRRTGTAVVVLPSDVDGDSAELIARRQAQRYPQESYEHWLAVTTKRPPINRALADVEVIARGSPEEVAALTFARLGAAGVLERR